MHVIITNIDKLMHSAYLLRKCCLLYIIKCIGKIYFLSLVLALNVMDKIFKYQVR
jgi:hypothetical protein